MPTNEIKVLPGIREEQRIALPSGATIPTAHLVDASGETLGTSGNPLHVHGNTGGGGGGDATAANQLTEIERLDTLVARTPALVNGASPITATPASALAQPESLSPRHRKLSQPWWAAQFQRAQ